MKAALPGSVALLLSFTAAVAFLPTTSALFFDLKSNHWCNSLSKQAKKLFPEGSNPSCDCEMGTNGFPISLVLGRQVLVNGRCNTTQDDGMQTVEFSRTRGIGMTEQCDENGDCVVFNFRKGFLRFGIFGLCMGNAVFCYSDKCSNNSSGSTICNVDGDAKWPFPSVDKAKCV